MNTKNTWITVALAAGLFAFIFFYERHAFKKDPPANKVLPYLNLASITSVQVRPADQKEIRADRTNGTWQLTKPVGYPAAPGDLLNLDAAPDGRLLLVSDVSPGPTPLTLVEHWPGLLEPH